MRNAFMVEVPSQEQINALLAMGELVIGGQKITVTQVRSRWRASDVFTWVAEELRVLEESEVLKNATLRRPWMNRGLAPRDDRRGTDHPRNEVRGTDHPRNEVKHIHAANTENAKDKATVKGGKGKSGDVHSSPSSSFKGKGKGKGGWSWSGRGKGRQEA